MPINAPESAGKKQSVAASEFFLQLAIGLCTETVSVGELLDSLRGRGVGILLLVFSLPLCIPNIPGISTLFGLLLLAPSIQMITHEDSVWMPRFVRKWQVKSEGLRKAFRICGKILRQLEYLARPRLVFLTEGAAIPFIGIQTLIMALILLLPMPGANVIPGVAVALTGLAILQRDGVCMVFGTIVAAGAMLWVYLGGKYILAFAVWAYETLSSLPMILAI